MTALVSTDGGRRVRAELPGQPPGAVLEVGLALRPETVGSVADSLPDVTTGEVRERLVESLGAVLRLAPTTGRILERSA